MGWQGVIRCYGVSSPLELATPPKISNQLNPTPPPPPPHTHTSVPSSVPWPAPSLFAFLTLFLTPSLPSPPLRTFVPSSVTPSPYIPSPSTPQPGRSVAAFAACEPRPMCTLFKLKVGTSAANGTGYPIAVSKVL